MTDSKSEFLKNESNTISVEEDVMKIVQRMVELNEIIHYSRIYNRCKNELKLEKNQILNVLDHLLEQKRIILGKKIVRDFILANKTRNIIYKFIEANPGIHFSAILKELGIANGVLLWNLEILQRFECIRKEKIQNLTIYAIFETPKNEILFHFFMRNPKIRNIVRILFKSSQCSNRDISDKSKIPYQTVIYYIKILQCYQIVKTSLIGENIHYVLETDFAQLMKN